MVRHAAALLISLGLATDGGCGVDAPPSGRNAPCTRQPDCIAGLVCVSGVCEDPDAGITDAGAPTDAAAADGGDAARDGA